MKFAHFLKYLREKQGLSKTDLARKLDVTPGYIMNLENEHQQPPTPERCEQIASILTSTESEKKKLFQLAYEGRLSDKEIMFQGIIGNPQPMKIRSAKIPVVSMAKGDDMQGFEFEQLEPHEYEYIDFDGCLGSKVMSNSMAPTLFKGQKFIYDPRLVPEDGDLAYVKLKTGEEYIKRIQRDTKRKLIVLESVNTITHGSRIVSEGELEFMYCVVGADYRIRKRKLDV